MKFRTQKKFKQGDQIHIVVTHDFEDTANDFYNLCKKRHFNASEVIRSNIKSWVEEQSEMQKVYENLKSNKQYST